MSIDMPKEIHLYTPPEFSKTMEKLSIILEAEHLSFSSWARKQAEAYVAAIENPQPPQQDVSTSAYPPACVVCGRKAEKWGLTNSVWVGFCAVHFDNNKFAVYR